MKGVDVKESFEELRNRQRCGMGKEVRKEGRGGMVDNEEKINRKSTNQKINDLEEEENNCVPYRPEG
jgi:hypothetical protein